ncbi:MAG: CAP domain-containing protein [Clostridiaceae bacterium]|nr:CAP domain-containing protein [Clostridiaceae bacterium]
MKKCKILFSMVAIFLLIIASLSGCTNYPARRYIQTDPNTNNMAAPNTPAIPGNVVGRAENNADTNKISATYEVVDFSYITTNGGNLNVKAGAGTTFPSVGILKSGQKIRALGKLDGWYVIKMPDSGRIGCIPSTNAKPYGTATGTDTTGTGTVIPAPVQGTTGEGAGEGTGAMSSDESRILRLVNAERAKTGAKSLSSSSECTRLARMKSQDMVNNNYFSHQSPTYGSPFDMLKSNKVSYMYAGENIAMNQSAEAAFKAWMNSEGHRKNILNPNFTELGIGIAPKGNGSYIYTQLFIGK